MMKMNEGKYRVTRFARDNKANIVVTLAAMDLILFRKNYRKFC